MAARPADQAEAPGVEVLLSGRVVLCAVYPMDFDYVLYRDAGLELILSMVGDQLDGIGYRAVQGAFAPAGEKLEWVCARCEGELAEQLAALPGQDTGVMAHIYLSVALWFLGYPEQSEEKMARAQALATESERPINLAYVCFYQVLMGLYQHDVPAAGRFADRLAAMAEQYEIGFLLAGGRAFQAYVAAAGDPADGRLLEAFEQRLALYHERVSRVSQPFFLSLKTRLLIGGDRYEAAQAALSQAIGLIDAIGERYSEAEVYRLQGDLWALTGAGDAEAIYWRAIDLAAEQQAKMYEIRTAVNLCRLWRQQNKRAEARRLLRETYGWFSEGFDTKDLREARALLDQLAPS